MRIGLDAKRAYNNFSGLGNYSRFVIKGLARYGQEDLLCYTPKTNLDLLNFVLSSKVSIRYPQKWFHKKIHSVWRGNWITKDFLNDKIDLYHGLSNEVPLGIKNTGVKSVVTIHDLIFERYPDYYKPLDRKIYRRKFQYAAQNADRVIAISQQTKQDLIQFYGVDESKIRIVYQDCSSNYYCDCIDDDNVKFIRKKYALNNEYLLCVGTLENRKNQKVLVEALSLLKNKDVELVLVGRATPYKDLIEETARKLGVASRIRIIHGIESRHLPALYLGAKLFCYPSEFEGFGIPILEALNSKVPVITGKGSCFEETGGNAATYVEQHDAKALSNNIEMLLEDEELRKNKINLGLEHAKSFRAEKVIPELIEVYKEVMNS